jgi:hypothetical protein
MLCQIFYHNYNDTLSNLIKLRSEEIMFWKNKNWGNSGSTHYHAIQNVVLFPITVQKRGKRAGHVISVKEEQKSDQETEGRIQLKRDDTRWRTGGEVKGKLANGVGSQYPSHYLGTWCIQHYCWWANLGCQ